MSSLRTLVESARVLLSNGEAFAIATVVSVKGSSYRRPGARMLLTHDEWIAGSVSGGCIEGELVRKIHFRLRGGKAVVTTYDSLDEDARDAFGLGCHGAIDVLQERATRAETDAIVVAERCIERQRRAAIATIVRSVHPRFEIGERVVVHDDGTTHCTIVGKFSAHLIALCNDALDAPRPMIREISIDGTSVDVFVEVLAPPPRLFVFGGGRDAVSVVSLARTLGWDAFVCTPHARTMWRERFAGAADGILSFEDGRRAIDASACAIGLVMNHEIDADQRALRTLLGSRSVYIGALGPRARTSALLDEIGYGEDDERLHAPVGLAIGAETPEEIALSIVAEVQATITRTSARKLRSHARIHEHVA